jgi:hypothetical protein
LRSLTPARVFNTRNMRIEGAEGSRRQLRAIQISARQAFSADEDLAGPANTPLKCLHARKTSIHFPLSLNSSTTAHSALW